MIGCVGVNSISTRTIRSVKYIFLLTTNTVYKEEVTKISADGLRYKSKKGGSPFGEGRPSDTMSCYKCGQHKLRSLGSFRKIVNQHLFICADCKNKTIKKV